MFIAGIRKFDRVRGDGWLDCPNCHEHAAQDVVDEMRFAALSFYRFTPIARSRVLRCRRCGYRRAATPEELGHLSTSGKRVARAWLVPVGLVPFFAVLIAVGAISLRSGSAANTGITYVTVSGAPVLPITLSIPAGYNHSVIAPENELSPGLYTASSGTFAMRLRRYPVPTTPADTLALHFDDDAGLNASEFPSKPPAATTVKVAGTDAQHVTLNYVQQGAPSVIELYTFNHGGVSYMLSFQELGSSGTNEAKAVLPTILASVTFTGNETPFPSPTASPGASSSSSSSSSSAAATPSPTPSH
jgi:hypothetical protein